MDGRSDDDATPDPDDGNDGEPEREPAPPKPDGNFLWDPWKRKWLTHEAWVRSTEHLHRPFVPEKRASDAEKLALMLIYIADLMRSPLTTDEELAAIRAMLRAVELAMHGVTPDDARNYLIALTREAAGCDDGLLVLCKGPLQDFASMFPMYLSRVSVVDVMDMVDAWRANRRGAPTARQRVRARYRKGSTAFEVCAEVWSRISGVTISAASCETTFHRWKAAKLKANSTS